MLRKWLLSGNENAADCSSSTSCSDNDDCIESFGLVSPSCAQCSEHREIISRVNKELLESPNSPSTGSRKRKHSGYMDYDAEKRAKMARFAVENGVMNASRKFGVPESSVRNLKKQFLELKKETGVEPETLEKKDRGKPPMLGAFDKELATYIKYQRLAGCPIGLTTLQSAGRGIVKSQNRRLLKEYGGHIEFSKIWCQSFFRRQGYVKRKGTKAARKVPSNFEDLKSEYLTEIQKLVWQNDIPDELIINFDQTDVYIVPAGHYTMEKEGSKQVPVIGLEDKRQISVVLASTLSGKLLPPQVIYQGTTDKCHPLFDFPNDWNITHSENHWSNTQTMLELVEKVLLPYVEGVRDHLPIMKLNTPALVIFDVLAAHKTDVFKTALKDANIRFRFVPAGCTGELQPLDLSGNDEFKRNIKQSFQRWYSDEIEHALAEGIEIENLDVNLKLSRLKPIHAAWLVDAHRNVKKESVMTGWRLTGLMDAIEKVC